jgi:hypothetical protein
MRTRTIFLSVLAWGVVNLVLLGIGASKLPLWVHHPYPRESLALQELLCGQVLLASLFFPLIAASGSLLINLAVMLPIDELGGMMSNASQMQVLRCYAWVCLWIVGLAGCGMVWKRPEPRIIASALASIFTIGGAVLDYLRWEAAAARGQGSSFQPLSLLPFFGRFCQDMNPVTWVLAVLIPLWLGVVLVLPWRQNRHSISLQNAS